MLGAMLGVVVMGVLLMRMDMLSDAPFATAKSGMPSLLKSSTATDLGTIPTSKLVARPKLPSPSPDNTDTLREV